MRLIDADALDAKLDELAKRYAEQKRFEAAKDYAFVQTVLLTAPTIDAVPVVHGRWDDDHYDPRFICEECGAWYLIEDAHGGMKYCPNCGAKMDGDAD